MNGKRASVVGLVSLVAVGLLITVLPAQPVEKRREDTESSETKPRSGRAGERDGAKRGTPPHRPMSRYSPFYGRRTGHAPASVEDFERMVATIQVIERMKKTCFEPDVAAMVALGGLRSDVRREPQEVIDDLEKQLTKLKTLGLRNCVRLMLKDLYKMTGKDDKILEHLRAMAAENDAAIQAEKK